MSASSTSTSDAGGRNEDVEADEATKSDDAKGELSRGDELEGYFARGGLDEDVGTREGPGAASTRETPMVVVQDEDGLEPVDGELPYEEFGDYAQIERQDRADTPDEEPGRLTAGPSTPPMPSPSYSDSIPDDTPSMQGSFASPGRTLSPTPRKAFSRTASGALQPFERRFEARRTVSSSTTATPKLEKPAFLSPHSRQISVTSHLSPGSSHSAAPSDDEPQAPWDVIKWTKLGKITGQAFSEAGKRNFGRPTCLAVSALIAVGTSKGLILGFDYHQTLKIIIGQGTKAAEAGAITALAIAADYTTIAGGHANGHIFTWEINKPAKPFLQIPSLEKSILQQSPHPDGHLEGTAILHIGFLGARHTALVSADAGGMAFSHLASRGLGAVARTIRTTRLLGRYPSAAPQEGVNGKPSSVLAFSPLPLGNVEQPTDGMGLTALLTPYLLVIVSTTPIAQTQHKSPRPKEVSKHGALSGCLAWFPSVRLKKTGKDGNPESSLAKLVYCWSDVLTVLDVEVLDGGDPKDAQKPPNLEFSARSRWKAEEAIVAVQWLGRSVLGVLTISQRLLIVEDGSLQVTDSIDLLHRHVYHSDQYSRQLHAVVEQVDAEDPELHGVVADAFHMSFKAYKGRTFLLGFNDLTVGTLSNWADRLLALMESGDHIAAIRLAIDYYAGGATNVTVGLPDEDESRHEMVKERLIAMLSASLNYTFSQRDEDRSTRLRELSNVSFEACLGVGENEYLFHDVYDWFEEADEESVFISTLEPYVLDGEVQTLPPDVVKALVPYFISKNEGTRLEELLCRLDPRSFDLDQITTLCRQHILYDAFIYVWTRALGDFVTPLIDLLTLVRMLQSLGGDDELTENPFFEATAKVFPFLAYTLTGRRYPSGDFMDDAEASQAKADIYEYLFAGTATAWPLGSKKKFHTVDNVDEEPAFPYLVLLLEFDPASFMSMLNEAFEDPFLNQYDEEIVTNGSRQANGITNRPGFKMTRQHIVSIMLDVMQQNDFEPEQTIFLDIFVARSLPKYPGQLVLSGSLLDKMLQRLCDAPLEAMREDCQLSVEYLLSAYRPTDVPSLIEALKVAQFHRVLKTVYRRERMFTELLETYFEDPEDKSGVFDSIAHCLQNDVGLNQKQLQKVKATTTAHVNDLADISTSRTAHTLAVSAPDLLDSSVNALRDSYQRFLFLQTLLEPNGLRVERPGRTPPSVPAELQASFTGQYVQLMCLHDPMHVADYVGIIPSSDLRLEEILPSMERSGVVDAAVVLLARDGLARDAMDRLVAHMQSLQQTLISLIEAAGESPDIESTVDSIDGLLEDVQKYTKVGIWLCQGQSATVVRRPRQRTNIAWDIQEDDLDLDEYLWLNLVDIVVQVTKNVSSALQHYEDHPATNTSSLHTEKTTSTLRSNVQQTFTGLLAATSIPQSKTQPNQSQQHQSPHFTFLRILRAFLTRAAITAPSLSDLRLVLADIFAAYTFETGVLSLANELLGSDIFSDLRKVSTLRQRGWRPRTQVCEICKRRAWGQGLGEEVWERWKVREMERGSEGVRRAVERGGGVEAERLERGKGRAVAAASGGVGVGASGGGDENEHEAVERRHVALVVFACRHCFHRSCLDGVLKRKGDTGGEEGRVYKCPICVGERT